MCPVHQNKIAIIFVFIFLFTSVVSAVSAVESERINPEFSNGWIYTPCKPGFDGPGDMDVDITIEPYNPPITIPSSGGNFQYAIEVVNNESDPITFDIWTDAILPNEHSYGPVLGPMEFHLPGKWSAKRDDITQHVPPFAPPGDYTYTAYIGIYPGDVWDSDSFTLEKLSGEAGWYAQMPGADRTLRGISFSDSENGWATGDYHTIIHTANGGDTWFHQDDGQYYIQNYNDVYFVDALTGWVIGSKILHTTDGGTTWMEQYEPSYNLYAGFFIDENNGWVVGGEIDYYFQIYQRVILQTSNGGNTWNTQLFQSGYYYDPIGPFNDVYFTDFSNGWAVGYGGAIFSTTDGGAHWDEQYTGIYNELYGVAFTDIHNGWATGEEGALLYTTNGGMYWNTFDLGTSDDLNSIVFADERNGWIAGSGYYPIHGSIFHTSDSGYTWELQDTGTGEDQYLLYDICFVDDDNGWAAGGAFYPYEGIMLHTETGGGPDVYPVLAYTPVSIDFGDMYGSQSDSVDVTVWNGGTGTLSYHFSADCTWLSFSPEGGFSSGEEDLVTVMIDTGGLQPGYYQCDVIITSNAGTSILPVEVTIIEANQELSFEPRFFDFGDMKQNRMETQILSIWNSGTGTMFYWIDDSDGFCIVEPWSGSSQGEVNEHTVMCFTSGLPLGPNECTLTIYSSGGNATIPVYVNVIP
jgi:photosystem II stability/assembly factor-like uncharacterized protein